MTTSANDNGPKTFWLSPLTACDVCKGEFNGTMYDAALPVSGGQWGNVCSACFTRHGCRVGVGYGQKYAKQTDGRWLCVEGY